MNSFGGPKPSSRPRPGGGFNSGFGQFGEHLDEQAMQQAASQKQLSQMAGNSQQQTMAQGQGGTAATQDFGQMEALQQMAAKGGAQQPGALAGAAARPVGTLQQELLERPVQDVVAGLKSLFDINAMLGINLQHDSPQEQARKKQMLQRWNQLTQDEQKVAQQLYQQKMQKKKQEQEEEEAKKRQEEQAKADSLAPPSSPQKGPVGPSGSKKQRAVTKLQQDRKTLGGPSGSH